MTNQKDYTTVLLGYGTGTQTIARYGCFMVAVYDALKQRGKITATVGQWNEYLKQIGVYTPEKPTLLDVATLGAKGTKYFITGRKEAYSDAKVIEYLAQPDKYILIGEVSAKGIGGTGQHFVKIIGADRENGVIKMTYIDDPWGGLDNQKITTRYGAYGNVLSLRVLELAEGATDMTDLYQYLGVNNDAEAKTRLKEHLGEKDGKSNWGAEGGEGGHLGAARRDVTSLRKQLADAKVAYDNQALLTDRTKEQLRVEQEAHTKTKNELETTKQLLVDCENKPITPPAEPKERGRLNGYSKTYVKDGITIKDNYTIDG